MVIWVGIVGSLYASINPFIYRLWNVANYNVAYYWAMMWAERWLLALKFHDAGFEWISGILTGNKTDNIRSMTWYEFWRFTEDATSDAYRKITSRVQSIPAPGKGDVESLFASPDSKDYNMLTYMDGLELPLYIDNTKDPKIFYTQGADIQPLDVWGSTLSLQWKFRLPPKIQTELWGSWLDVSQDIDDDTIGDDVVVNWGLQGIDANNNDEVFSIFPTLKNDFSRWEPLYAYDNAIRESVINDGNIQNNIDTSVNSFSLPSAGNSVGNALTANNTLPLDSSFIDMPLNDVLTSAIKPYLTFSITNRMQTTDRNIYPFLERQLKACTMSNCDVTLPNRFYSLQWVWVVKDYTVHIYIHKPVRKSSNTANFTIIF